MLLRGSPNSKPTGFWPLRLAPRGSCHLFSGYGLSRWEIRHCHVVNAILGLEHIEICVREAFDEGVLVFDGSPFRFGLLFCP